MEIKVNKNYRAESGAVRVEHSDDENEIYIFQDSEVGCESIQVANLADIIKSLQELQTALNDNHQTK